MVILLLQMARVGCVITKMSWFQFDSGLQFNHPAVLLSHQAVVPHAFSSSSGKSWQLWLCQGSVINTAN